jgi:predicted HicB family RNase H-like nuclease
MTGCWCWSRFNRNQWKGTLSLTILDNSESFIPIEKSYKGNLNIPLSPDLHKKAAYNAALKGVSLNQYINDAIKEKLTSTDTDLK